MGRERQHNLRLPLRLLQSAAHVVHLERNQAVLRAVLAAHLERAMILPPEVLRLLGDDATPWKAIEKLEASRDRNVTRALEHFSGADDSQWATKAHWMAIAAAAIRECETGRAFTAALKLPKEQCDVASDAELKHRETMATYDALRNWRKA